MWQTKERQEGTQNAKCAGDIERVLRCSSSVGASCFLNVGENISSDESANFANRGSDSVYIMLILFFENRRDDGRNAQYCPRTPVAQVLEAMSPILSPGPSSPRERKMP